MHLENKMKYINKFKLHDKDYGSISVQIINLSYEIDLLTGHLKIFKKDKHSKIGLIKKINRRKKFLKYLKKTDVKLYETIVKDLEIRK